MGELAKLVNGARDFIFGKPLGWTIRIRLIDSVLYLWYILLLKNGYVDYVALMMGLSIVLHAIRILRDTFKREDK